jgi:hypothetical protein
MTLIVLAVALVACSSTTPTTTDAVSAATTDGPKVELVVPAQWLALQKYIPKALANLGKHFEIPIPDTTVYWSQPHVHPAMPGYYIGGYYTQPCPEWPNGRIELWTRGWSGDKDINTLVELLLHEWLHHYDEMSLIPHPTSAHNTLFSKRIQEMSLKIIAQGWDVPE